MANSNIFQQYLQAPKSVLDYSNDYAKADALKNQNALQSLNLQQQQAATAQSLNERNALQRIAAQSGGDRNTLISGLRNSGLPGLMTQADALEQGGAKLAETNSVVGKNDAETATKNYDLHRNMVTHGLQSMLSSSTPQQAAQAAADGVQQGYWSMEDAQKKIANIPQDPAQYSPWRLQQLSALVSAKDQLDASKPVLGTTNTGGTTNYVSRDPMTGAVTQNGSVKMTQSPDNAATQAGENARAAAGRATQLTIAGMSANGQVSPAIEAEAQMIASGRAAPPTGMAATRPAAAALMQRVSQINPTYDATSYSAKIKAAKDFTSGTQGNALRSFAVAGQHLDQLGTLVDALDNGNVQIINKIGNQIGAQLGSTAPTNFDAAKDVVSKEVTKAIVGGGGGVSERAELANLLSEAKTPAQLKGVITQYRGLMSAQHDALIQQRTAAGLSDSTLPGYSEGTPMAPGAFKITHIDGKPQ